MSTNGEAQQQQQDEGATSMHSAASGSLSAAAGATSISGDSQQQPKKKLNLFDYSEEELLHDNALNYYDILGLEEYATQDEVKKAYRKASLKYHPDKTGRGTDDYVFLAVKAAHDTLYDPVKRQGYDSTVMPFDDAIPAPREKLMADPILLYKDEDFYDTYGPVFRRNLRFDARLRPEMASATSASSGSASGKNSSRNSNSKPQKPPELGDDTTDMQQVHAFYEYWIHFESWRDFSAQAAEDLQVDNELENAESRYEKRWIQKEIDKRAKQLKRQEMNRIQTLVERAMEADPRLRRERQEAIQAKERAKQERERAKILKKQEEERLAAEKIQQEEEEKRKRAEEKVQREKEKKLLRKARQALRKQASASFSELPSSHNLWEDSYDMNQDVEYLCTTLNTHQLKRLSSKYEEVAGSSSSSPSPSSHVEALQMIKDKVERLKTGQDEDETNNGEEENNDDDGDDQQVENDAESEQNGEISNDAKEPPSSSGATTSNGAGNDTSKNAEEDQKPQATSSSTSTAKGPWTKEELSALAKAVKKYPPGGSSRWEQIALFVNNLCKQSDPRSKEECIEKYNTIARRNAPPTTSSSSPTAASIPSKSESSKSTTLRAQSTVSEASFDSVAANGDTTAAIDADGGWTAEQDQQLQDALVLYPASMDKNERWNSIAKAVTGKSKKECVQRFKAIRDAIKQTRK